MYNDAMSLIPVVGRKSPRIRFLVAGIYTLLILGSITTVYPFLVMLGSSITSEYDQDKYAIVPAYLTSVRALFGKYAGDKYCQDLVTIDGAYNSDFAGLDTVTAPKATQGDEAETTAWNRFFAALPASYKLAGFRGSRGSYSPAPLYDKYHVWLRDRFHGDIRGLDKTYVEEDTNFLSVYPPFESPTKRLYAPGQGPKDRDWAEFEKTLPQSYFYPVLCDPLYQAYLHDEVYGGKIEDLNDAWGTKYKAFTDIHLPVRAPENAIGIFNSAIRAEWTDFVRTKMPLRYISLDSVAYKQWQTFLASRRLAPQPLPASGILPTGDYLRAYNDFVRTVDPSLISAVSVENRWRAYRNDPNARPPLAQADRQYVGHNVGRLRWDFLTRNYTFALDYLLLHGRGVLNTVLYCAGAVLIAVIINPMCAYALSRFRLPYAQSVLLFLLATMAFPAEVAMIPNFLLLKQLGLLNTFWALILPSAASGFSIFLLKGFFDSLPQELYEAGMIDGAGEITLFTRVTLPLARPIFAVIALQAFTAAYGAFIFAMIVCQAQSHWTLMVWIYEFQALQAPQYIMMAALVIAALPTLLVFMAAQKVIMRGIILPSFK